MDVKQTLERKIDLFGSLLVHQMVGDKTYSGFECSLTRRKLLDLQSQYKFFYGRYHNGKN